MLEPGVGGPPEPQFAEISVDLERLEDFARLLREENEANLEPYAARIIEDHGQGVLFGARSLSNEVRVTRATYQQCLVGSVAALNAYVQMSQFLVHAIEEVGERYSQVDSLAANRAEQVAAELNYALYTVEKERREALDAARAARRIEQLAGRQERLESWGPA